MLLANCSKSPKLLLVQPTFVWLRCAFTQRAILEKDTTLKAQLLVQCGDLLNSVTAPATASKSSKTAESVNVLKSELWTRLAAASLSAPSPILQRLSVCYAYKALGECHCTVPYKIPLLRDVRQQLWKGMAHVLAGLALLTAGASR